MIVVCHTPLPPFSSQGVPLLSASTRAVLIVAGLGANLTER